MRTVASHLLCLTLVLSFSYPVASQSGILIQPNAKIAMRLLTPIDSSKMKTGEIIKFDTIKPLVLGSCKVPSQTPAIGRVVRISLPANEKGKAQLGLIVEKLVAKDCEVVLHAYPIRLFHKIARIQEAAPLPPMPDAPTISRAGPPASSPIVSQQPPRPQPSIPVGSSEQPRFGPTEVVQVFEPMPTVKHIEQPPSTILIERGNIVVSAGTTVIVKQFEQVDPTTGVTVVPQH